MKKFIMICVLILSISSVAFADDGDQIEHPFYIGGGMGMSFFDGDADFVDHEEINVNDTTFTAKIFAGYRFHKNIAIELGLHHFGEVEFKETFIKNDKLINREFAYTARGMDLSLLWIAPAISGIEVFLRTGMLYTGFSGNSIEYFTDKDALSFVLGMGANVELTDRLSISPEIQWSPNVLRSNGEGEYKFTRYKYRSDKTRLKYSEEYSQFNPAADIDILSVTMNFIYRF